MGGRGFSRRTAQPRSVRRARLGPFGLTVLCATALALLICAVLATPAARANGTIAVAATDQTTSAPLSEVQLEVYPYGPNLWYEIPVVSRTDLSGCAAISLPAAIT